MNVRHLLIIFFFLLPFSFQAQQTLLDPERLWTMVETHCQPQGNVYSSHYLKVAGADTTIEGNVYKKLDYSADEAQTLWYEYGGFIRETPEGKVYYRRSGLDEGLIYDFSAQLGDTVVVLNQELISESLNMVVILEDSMLLEDGWHRIMILEDDNFPGEETWIEGIGSVSGLVRSCQNAFGSSCGDYNLLCTSDGDISVYINPNFPSCWYVTTRIGDGVEINTLKLYPNPVRDVLTIEGEFLKTGQSYRIQLIDFTGRTVIDRETSSSQLDMSKLISGMYFMHLQTSSANYSGKILKY